MKYACAVSAGLVMMSYSAECTTVASWTPEASCRFPWNDELLALAQKARGVGRMPKRPSELYDQSLHALAFTMCDARAGTFAFLLENTKPAGILEGTEVRTSGCARSTNGWRHLLSFASARFTLCGLFRSADEITEHLHGQ
jgi:hypothetical protein